MEYKKIQEIVADTKRIYNLLEGEDSIESDIFKNDQNYQFIIELKEIIENFIEHAKKEHEKFNKEFNEKDEKDLKETIIHLKLYKRKLKEEKDV